MAKRDRSVREARVKLEKPEGSGELGGIEVGARYPERRVVGAGEFKAKCLKLMDEVQETGQEILITKHGRAVARLVPLGDKDLIPFVGRSPGVIHISPEDLLAPTGEDWMPGADL